MKARLLFSSAVLASSFALAVGMSACGKKQPPKEPAITETIADAGPEDAADAAPPAPKSLYERLGGKEGITKVVDSFVKNVVQNDTIKKRFTKLPKERVEKFKTNLIAQICKETGGDCEYTGKSMKDAHKGMRITEAEWNATVSALKAALDEHKVGDTEQGDLIAIIAPMKDDIAPSKKK